jgi:hypothetical protein
MTPKPPECVLCDWSYDPGGTPRFVYRSCGQLPLRWDPDGAYPVREVRMDEKLSVTVPWVALVTHWSEAHPEQLTGLIDAWELSDDIIRLG